MKQITVLSGKGGVGKSSICASLAVCISKTRKIICADCDVDASNLPLVFGVGQESMSNAREISTGNIARFNPDKCISCRKCIDMCFFDAIEWDEGTNKPALKDFGCEGCGVCQLVCPSGAVELASVKNAKIGIEKIKYGFYVVFGQLKMGQSGSGKIVSEVKKLAMSNSENAEIMLVDSAAGIGCSVIASVAGSDYCLVVTEPTPSGFSDLKRAVELISYFNIPCDIIINKFDLNADYVGQIHAFADEKGIRIISKIHYDKSFGDALVNMVPVIVYNPELEKLFCRIADFLIEKIYSSSSPA
ncbi:MAG: P-loop ATPase [Candidatus Nanohalarchaeota archaeon]|nr:MAG: P-loop ATPase [Candidatus Nanohaloarchaeota archaeon]